MARRHPVVRGVTAPTRFCYNMLNLESLGAPAVQAPRTVAGQHRPALVRAAFERGVAQLRHVERGDLDGKCRLRSVGGREFQDPSDPTQGAFHPMLQARREPSRRPGPVLPPRGLRRAPRSSFAPAPPCRARTSALLESLLDALPAVGDLGAPHDGVVDDDGESRRLRSRVHPDPHRCDAAPVADETFRGVPAPEFTHGRSDAHDACLALGSPHSDECGVSQAQGRSGSIAHTDPRLSDEPGGRLDLDGPRWRGLPSFSGVTALPCGRGVPDQTGGLLGVLEGPVRSLRRTLGGFRSSRSRGCPALAQSLRWRSTRRYVRPALALTCQSSFTPG